MATNSVTTDWNSVLSTAQAGLTSTQNQIKDLEAQAAPLRKQMNDAKAALDAQQSFYQAAIEKYRPKPSLSEILYLKDAWEADPNNATKKAAWDKAYALFQQQSKVLEQETSMFPGIISSLQRQYSDAQARYNAVWKQLPPLYEKEAQYKQQITQAQSSLGTQAKGTTPANTTTVSATTVPASNQPGNASVATTTTTTISTAYKAPPPIDSSLEGSPEYIAQQQNDVAEPVPLAISTIGDVSLANTDQINADIANLQIELPDIAVDSDYAALYDTESQATQQDQANFEAKEDWRVRLSLAPDAEYLYNAKDPGILKPLATNGGTDGVIFPYTPAISVNYAANYEQTNIVHSNYKLFQYSGSGVDQVSISCTFTAQDEYEANYLLAVIHFFRTMTKMFYGQDENPKNGTPPPLCYMYGMGGYQFAAHPLAIQGFSYNLPDDVDYIKTTSESPAGAPVPSTTSPSEGRLAGTGVEKGGRGPGPSFQNTTKTEATTWVPTRIQMTITCVPIMSRNAISNRFSLRDYASGKLVLGTKEPGGGMW